MVTPIKVVGMVLAAMPVGDYDKRLVILTKERGKISVFAKGARKQTSALLACSQPFTFGEFSLYESRTAYNIISVEVLNYFSELRNNLELVYYGFYFCEFAEYLTRENVDSTDILKLLYQSLKALLSKKISRELIKLIFELKILVFNGEAPQVFECIKCRKCYEKYYFSSKKGGLLCNECIEGETDLMILKGTTIYTMQFVITSSIEKLYTFTLADDIFKELKDCMKNYMNTYVDKDFNSLKMLQLV